MVAITDKESTLSIDERIKVDHKDIRKSASSSLGSFTDSSADYNHSISGYVPDLKWTEEEEKKVLFKIDTKLMPFVLLMTFVLNMDRTNICKFTFFYITLKLIFIIL